MALPENLPTDMILTFGKYKGMSVRAVLRKDAGYIRWAVSSGALASAIARASKLVTIAEVLPGATVIDEVVADIAELDAKLPTLWSHLPTACATTGPVTERSALRWRTGLYDKTVEVFTF